MEDTAAAILGEPVIDSVVGLAPGFSVKGRTRMTGIFGVAGALAGRKVVEKTSRAVDTGANALGEPQAGMFVLTASWFAIFRVVEGKARQKLGELATKVPYDHVARIDCSETAAAGVRKLEVVLTNGDRYPFELSSLKVKTVERMRTALGLGATAG